MRERWTETDAERLSDGINKETSIGKRGSRPYNR